jgi:hypothetical protein
VVSPLERAVLASERPFLNVEIVSNVHTLRGRRAGFDARQDILFVGGFQHPPNVDGIRWFVSEVWPLVRRELPEARLHIAGSNTPVEVTSLASDSVIVHGWVPDLDPLLDRARVSVAPLRVGAGVKGKINQAMSYGLPVVATSIAVEGMNLEQERQVLIADAPDAFARALTRLYLDGELWARLSDGGLENVRTCFSDTVAEAALRRVIAPNLPSRARLFALDVSGMTELLGAARTSPTQSILIDPFTHEPDRVRVDSIARASLRPDAPTVFGRPIVVAQLGERPPVQASVERLRGHLASAGIGDAFLIGYDGRGMRSPTSMSSGIDAIATREPPLTSAARAEAWVSSRVQRLRRRGVPTPTAKPVSSPLMPRSIPVIDVDVEGALDRLRATIAELRGRVPEARIVFLIGARSLAQRFADELARSWSEAAAARVPAQLRSPDSDGVAPPLSIRR